MSIRHLALATALVLAGASAQANVVSFSTFTLGSTQSVGLVATTSTPNNIVSFEVLSAPLLLDSPGLFAYTVYYGPLAAATYTVKLETLGLGPVQTSASGGVSGALTLTPVPEPETYAMGLAGLSVAGLLLRRRRARQA